jgi:nucleotide-binding universal stress UspA family protein
MVAESVHFQSASTQPQDVKIRHILLAFDGSEHARAAVELVQNLPTGGDQVRVLAVMPAQHITYHEALQAMLDEVQRALQAHGHPTETVLQAGNPAATINALAAEIQADLVVLGAQGLRATLGILLGGVAQQVVEYSTSPVLVVRAPYRGIRRILLAVDGSPHSHKAVEYLTPPCPEGVPGRAADQRCFWLPAGAEVHVLHVLPPPMTADMAARYWTLGPEALYPVPPEPAVRQRIEEEELRLGERILADVVGSLESAGIHAIGKMPRGDAATEIIQYVKEQSIDLIVCGSRGLSQVTSWLLGSLSRKLVHYAGCSVLIVK